MTKPPPRRFRLVRYFTQAALTAFLVVGAVLYFLERKQTDHFREVEDEHRRFIAELQDEFVRRHEQSSRDDLIAVHEVGHVTLTRALGNALWSSHLQPFLSRTDAVPAEACREAAQPLQVACFEQVGRRIRALPEFQALDVKLAQTVRGSDIFKIKVFDMRGLTVYSSEHRQVGEDKRDNEGWRVASAGRPASELTRRDRFSAFEKTVENRDLISTYVPVFSPADPERITGVFEIYSDVTPLLERIARGTQRLAEQSQVTQERLARASAANQQSVESRSRVVLAVVLGLLALLYVALLSIVRRAQRILAAQERAREEWSARESRWHKEKMAALATMAANIAHEIGNPLAVISGIAQDVASPQILKQAQRIAEKTRQMADFAASHGETPQLVDVNENVGRICDFLAYDRRFRATPVEFRPGSGLPAPIAVPDHLTESVMNLLLLYVTGPAGRAPVRIVVSTAAEADQVLIRIECEPAPGGPPALSQAALESIARRVAEMGGAFKPHGDGFTIALAVATHLTG